MESEGRFPRIPGRRRGGEVNAAIYVDEMMPTVTSRKWRWSHACHLFHEDHDLAALDAFAISIGMRTAWRHDVHGFPHYDLHATHRAKAIAAGAIAIGNRSEIMRAMFAKRRAALATRKSLEVMIKAVDPSATVAHINDALHPRPPWEPCNPASER